MNKMYYFIDKRWKIFIVWALFTVTLSSIYYLLVNYKFYYKGAEWQILSEANITKSAIESFIAINNGNDNKITRLYVDKLINKDKSYVKVVCFHDGAMVWQQSNNKENSLDGSRSIVSFEDNIHAGKYDYQIKIQRGNRPHWYVQLYRAWTFSLTDYLRDKDGYIKGRKDYRSWPLLYSIIVTGIFVMTVLMYFRKINIDRIKQLMDLKTQLDELRDEKEILSLTIDKLRNASNGLSSENALLKKEINKYKSIEGIVSSLSAEKEQLKSKINETAGITEEHQKLKNDYDEVCEYNDIINKQLEALMHDLDNKKNKIRDKEIAITELQNKILLARHVEDEDISSQKKVDRILKTVLPHVLFTKYSIRQIVKEAPLQDMATLETMSQLLVALDANHDYDELSKRYSCEEMCNNVYRLKKAKCRVYFYFIPKNLRNNNLYKNSYAEVVYVTYHKKQQSAPEYIEQCKPSWAIS